MISHFEALLQRIIHPSTTAASGSANASLNRSSNSSLLDYLAASPVARGVQAYHQARRAAASTGDLNSLSAELAAEVRESLGGVVGSAPADPVLDAAGNDVLLGAHGGSIGGCLVRYDEAWLAYLDQFAAWKLEDAAGMETELIRMSVEMEKSMRRKIRGRPNMGERGRSAEDIEVSTSPLGCCFCFKGCRLSHPSLLGSN